jgi:putative ATPase
MPHRPRPTPAGSLPLPTIAEPGGASHVPLAARLRPQALADFVGQAHLVQDRGPLRRMIEGRRLISMLLWGPPGVGKTTLARLLADAVDAPFSSLSAVMSGVADIRAVIARAREYVAAGGGSSVLFIDEIHRFNKAQQDALLPQVEDGTLTLIGATTENPYYEVNSALLSRLRVFRLEPLSDDEVRSVLERAVVDPQGFEGGVRLEDLVLEHLLAISGGDARAALNVLESAVGLAGGVGTAEDPRMPTVADVEAAAQQRVLAYDRAGDGHYDTVSAFIKSMRGNDPDAALYWLATMVAAGEDPRFICRRIIICASEDVGNADPRALQVAMAAAQALDWVGLPEAQYAMAQATAYVASAPKSARAGRAYWAAMEDVEALGSLPVPLPGTATPEMERRAHGIGLGYRNPHDAPGADIDQQYLPDRLAGRRYYEPSDQGMESQIAARLVRIRAARTGDG